MGTRPIHLRSAQTLNSVKKDQHSGLQEQVENPGVSGFVLGGCLFCVRCKGPLGVFDLREVVTVDSSVEWEVFFSDTGNLTIRRSDTPPGNLVWGMGDNADVTCSVKTEPERPEFDFQLETGARFSPDTTENLELIVVLN